MKTKSKKNLREAFFNKAQESFAIFDKDLNFIDVNEVLLRLLQVKREQIVGKNIAEISPGIEKTERYKLYQKVIQTGKPAVIDGVRLDPGLGDFVTRVSVFKVGEGMGLSALNIIDLEEAIDELETFTYKSSHDMRAPISSILGIVNLAAKDTQNMETAFYYFNMIKQQTERLDTILKTLIETTRIRKGEKTIELIDFEEIIGDLKKVLSFMEGFKEIHFNQEIKVSQKIYSDKLLLVSLFQNLMDNAIKYKKESTKDSYIKIRVSDENEGVKITIADNGIGIPGHLQKDVFKMFFRGTEKATGSGLGLYTVKHSVKKLGGRISVESRENIGTTFTVYLPNEKWVEEEK